MLRFLLSSVFVVATLGESSSEGSSEGSNEVPEGPNYYIRGDILGDDGWSEDGAAKMMKLTDTHHLGDLGAGDGDDVFYLEVEAKDNNGFAVVDGLTGGWDANRKFARNEGDAIAYGTEIQLQEGGTENIKLSGIGGVKMKVRVYLLVKGGDFFIRVDGICGVKTGQCMSADSPKCAHQISGTSCQESQENCEGACASKWYVACDTIAADGACNGDKWACCDEGLECFEKTENDAVCMTSCSDADWTCRNMDTDVCRGEPVSAWGECRYSVCPCLAGHSCIEKAGLDDPVKTAEALCRPDDNVCDPTNDDTFNGFNQPWTCVNLTASDETTDPTYEPTSEPTSEPTDVTSMSGVERIGVASFVYFIGGIFAVV